MSQRIAVIGSGIAGLASAWLLSRHHEVTLFEADARLGGHTHTVDVNVDGKTFPVDTGFLVFNHRTYPELTALFRELEVETTASNMSFSVKLAEPQLEWVGENLATVFGQRANLLRPAFLGMLRDLMRFNREAVADPALASPITLGDYLETRRYGRAFIEWYLLPMAAATWSCPARTMLEFPLSSFVIFCQNHGLLQVLKRPQWRTVVGGGREYVKRMATHLTDIRAACPVHAIQPRGDAVSVSHAYRVETYDQVVLACHSDQARRLLGHAYPQQSSALADIAYQPNRAVLHTDRRVLPQRQALWSAWNYEAGTGDLDTRPVAVNDLINTLQPLPTSTPVIVSLNPVSAIDPAHVHGEFHYSHPVITREARAAQQMLRKSNGQDKVWFAGAWMGYGFHEDGLGSAIQVARKLGIEAPWRDYAHAA